MHENIQIRDKREVKMTCVFLSESATAFSTDLQLSQPCLEVDAGKENSHSSFMLLL